MGGGSGDLVVRRVAEGDRAEWGVLWDGYRRFYQRPEQDAAAFDHDFARLFSDDPHAVHGLVAEADGRLVGLAHYLFHASSRFPGGTCYLQDLFTAGDTRGKGVGRALIEAVAQIAARHGAAELYWLTAEDNYRGRMLYDRVATRTPFIKYARPLTPPSS